MTLPCDTTAANEAQADGGPTSPPQDNRATGSERPSVVTKPTVLPRLSWSALTHRGKVRKNNEDAFIGLCFDGHELHYLGKNGEAPTDTLDFVFAVSDGMGGAQAGEFASRIAIDKLSHWLPRSFKLTASGVALDHTEVLQEVFHAIHAELLLLGRSYEECRDMGATLSLCWVTPQKMYFCHIGDSRIYHLPSRGPLRQLSHDHTHPGWLRRQGKINEREARQHPMKHLLNQVLGAGRPFIEPQVGAVLYDPGDRFLLCSDGLIDGLWDHHLEEFARKPLLNNSGAALAEHLVTEALDRSGRDNLTAIVIETS